MNPHNGSARRLTWRAESPNGPDLPIATSPVAMRMPSGIEPPLDRNEPARPPSKRSRWVFLGLAALFWWSLLRGLFRKDNFDSLDDLFGGLSILALALLFSWLSRRAFLRYLEPQMAQK